MKQICELVHMKGVHGANIRKAHVTNVSSLPWIILQSETSVEVCSDIFVIVTRPSSISSWSIWLFIQVASNMCRHVVLQTLSTIGYVCRSHV